MAKNIIKKDEKNIHVGLDIGSHSVKAAAISHTKNKPQLVSFSVKPLGEDCIQQVKNAYAELGLGKRKVLTSISGPSVVARYIEMPSMTDEELKSAARFEAEKVIPYSLNQVILDSVKVEDLGENRIRVLIVAVKKDAIDMRLQILSQAELEPLIMDIDSFAVMNAFVAAGVDTDNVCGLLNIGAKTTNLNITKGDVSYLSRDIEIGGNDITKVISEKLSLPEAEGDKIKIEKISQFAQLPPEEKKELGVVFEELLSRLADEVRLSFDFYETHYAANVSNIYISGGTSLSEETGRILKENLGCNTLRWDPLVNIDVAEGLDREALKKLRSQLAVAIGLALRKND